AQGHWPVRSNDGQHFYSLFPEDVPSMSNRCGHSGSITRLQLLAAVTALIFIFIASPGQAAASPLDNLDKDITENILAIELAPVVDYGILSRHFQRDRQKPVAVNGAFAMATPPAEDEEKPDPKPMKPPDRPGI